MQKAAHIEKQIEAELLERLKAVRAGALFVCTTLPCLTPCRGVWVATSQGTYGDIYNFPQQQFNSALDKEKETQAGAASAKEMEEEDDSDVGESEFVEVRYLPPAVRACCFTAAR